MGGRRPNLKAHPERTTTHDVWPNESHATSNRLAPMAGGPLARRAPATTPNRGGDITAGAVALNVDETKATQLFIDFGTNGEMVLAKDGMITGCSVAWWP